VKIYGTLSFVNNKAIEETHSLVLTDEDNEICITYLQHTDQVYMEVNSIY